MKYATKLASMQLGQRADWSILQESPIGMRYQSHAAKIVTATVRFGRHIRYNQIAFIPDSDWEEQLLKKAVVDVAEERKKGKKASSTKLTRLMAAERVLRIAQLVRLHEKTKRSHAYQVIGATALIYGLNSQELKDTARKMHAMEANQPEMVTWDGDSVGPRKATISDCGARKNYTISSYHIISQNDGPISSQ